jgi:hypothetical protein
MIAVRVRDVFSVSTSSDDINKYIQWFHKSGLTKLQSRHPLIVSLVKSTGYGALSSQEVWLSKRIFYKDAYLRAAFRENKEESFICFVQEPTPIMAEIPKIQMYIRKVNKETKAVEVVEHSADALAKYNIGQDIKIKDKPNSYGFISSVKIEVMFEDGKKIKRIQYGVDSFLEHGYYDEQQLEPDEELDGKEIL